MKHKWGGIEVEDSIYNICEHFKKIMEEKNIYSSAYDFQIFSCAVQYYLYNGLVTKLIGSEKSKNTIRPATRELTTTGESFRKALRELNLTGHNKKVDIEDNNPLDDMIKAMQDEEDVVIKKKDES